MSSDDYTFGIERFDSILEELFPLWREHHNELVGEQVPLQPDIARYIAVQQQGNLVVFSIRDKNNKLCGYSFFFLSKHIHRTQVIKADNDLFFITKSHRKGWLAKKFIKYCEKKLFNNNISQIGMRTKNRASFGPLLEYCGYVPEEQFYLKVKE